jgi:hypothetical protein
MTIFLIAPNRKTLNSKYKPHSTYHNLTTQNLVIQKLARIEHACYNDCTKSIHSRSEGLGWSFGMIS